MSSNTLIQIDALIKQRNAELSIVDSLLNECLKPSHPQVVIDTLLNTCEEKIKLADEYFQLAKYKFLNDLNKQ